MCFMAGQDYMSAVEHIQNLYTTLKKDVSAEELASVQEMWDGRYKWKMRSFFFLLEFALGSIW